MPLIGLMVGLVSSVSFTIKHSITGYLETMLARPELISISYLFCGVDFQPMYAQHTLALWVPLIP